MHLALAALLFVGLGQTAGNQAAPTVVPPTGQVAEKPKAPDPVSVIWKLPFEPTAARIAVGDLRGDGKARVAALLPQGGGKWRLATYLWNGVEFARETTADLGTVSPLLSVGRFAATGPAQILTGAGLHIWNGSEYALRPAPHGFMPVGWVRRRDGQERAITADGASYAVSLIDLAASGDAWLARDADSASGLGPDGSYTVGVLHAAPSQLEAAMPAEFASTGVLGFWSLAGAGAPVRVVVSRSVKGPITSSALVLASSLVPPPVEVWRSPPLDGRVGDMAFGDPRADGAEGVVLLSAASANGQGRLLYYIAPTKAIAPTAAPVSPAPRPAAPPRVGRRKGGKP